MLDSDRRMLGVGNQLPGGAGLAAKPFKYVQVVRAGTYNARRRAFYERTHESERLIEGGRGVEDSGVCHDADKARQGKHGEGERFRPRRQPGDPIRILGVIWGRVLDVGVNQDIDIRDQHVESSTPAVEPGRVVLCVERPRPVKIDPGAGMDTAHGH